MNRDEPSTAGERPVASLRTALDAAASVLSREPVPPMASRVGLAWAAAGACQDTQPLVKREARAGRWAGRWAGATAAVAAILVAAVALTLAVAPPDDRPAATRVASDFVPVAGSPAWPGAQREPAGVAWLVATELPRERLALLGLPFDPARAAEPVRAELLMNPTGTVLAVRVLAE